MADAQRSANKQAAQTAAKASWVAILLPIPVRLAIQAQLQGRGPDAYMVRWVSVAVTVACLLIGLGAGLYALARVRAVGREGVLVPALVGTTVNAALLVVLIVAALIRSSF